MAGRSWSIDFKSLPSLISWGPQQCRKKPPDILQIPLINLVLRYQKCLDFRLASL
jgi:hypothetical protein